MVIQSALTDFKQRLLCFMIFGFKIVTRGMIILLNDDQIMILNDLSSALETRLLLHLTSV